MLAVLYFLNISIGPISELMYWTLNMTSIKHIQVLTNSGQQGAYCLNCKENHEIGHQRSDFMAKMHQMRFRLWLRPRPL